MPGVSGWASFESPACPSLLMSFGFTASGGNAKVVIQSLRFDHLQGIGPVLLSRIPVQKIEACVNRPAWRAMIEQHLPPVGVKWPPPGWSQIPDGEPYAATPPTLRLDPPAGRPKPDSFYARVAEVFGYLTEVSTSPASDLAAANGVPATTVHGWVKEARRRRLLPAGQRSRVSPMHPI
jgi:hypothetical protein